MDEFKTKEAVAAFKDDPVLTPAKWVQWAVVCAERALPMFEDKYPDDARPRRALDAARKWLHAPSTKTANAAAHAARAVAYAASYADAAAHAARAVAYAANAAAHAARAVAYAANAAAHAAHAAHAAANAAAHAAYAAHAKEEQWQVIRLLSIYHEEE